jgi:hypothetical protein
MNAKKLRGLVAVKKWFKFGYAEETITSGTDGGGGKASCHNVLLFQQNAPDFHRPSKTFFVNVDALEVSGRRLEEIRGNGRRKWLSRGE